MINHQSTDKPAWILLIAATVLVFLVSGSTPVSAGGWFKAAGGVSGMAMGDINDGDFRFYDQTVNGYNFPDLDSGFSLSFHLGYDMSPELSLGFSWDNQYASVKGTDVDITADLNLRANLFMTHLYWTPLRTGRWALGGAAGLGLIFPVGDVEITGENNVNWGQGEITGSSGLALEAMGLVEFAVGGSTSIELTVGWRSAEIDDFKVENRPALKEDGTPIALDYTGYIVKAGVKFMFGGDG
ncbi:MAG: hypothetical protein KAH56_04770 [Candidatus Krumholzibacteria bacterium]|nr:hypothetical protein [Candidatus Krumholzibacteria bacterium]